MSCLQSMTKAHLSSLGRVCIVLFHMQHHREDIFRGELSDVRVGNPVKEKEDMLTFDNLSPGCLLEELALSDDRL